MALVSLVLASCSAEEVPTAKPVKNQVSLAKDGDIDPPTSGTGTGTKP